MITDDFETDFLGSIDEKPKMTKDEFIEKAKKLLTFIIDGYSNHFEPEIAEDDEDNICNRCNGFLYICEGGVPDVDCPSCKGTGKNLNKVLNQDLFCYFIEHEVIFGNQPFIDLMDCEIID